MSPTLFAVRKVMNLTIRRPTLRNGRTRFALFLVATILLGACDGYIEELRIQPDGSIELAAQAIVVCTDPLQQAIWGGDPCDQIDTALRTGDVGELPFDFELDPDRVSLVGTEEADRRTIDVAWSGTAEEYSSILAGPGTVTQLNDEETEVIFSSRSTPFEALQESTDPDIALELSDARWEPGEFRINTPELITEHNGDEIQGRIVIWNLDGDQPDEFRVVFSSADPPVRWWWWLVGSSILLVVLAMMVTLEEPPKKKSKKAAKPPKA